jgi:hypothetical protein
VLNGVGRFHASDIRHALAHCKGLTNEIFQCKA